MNPKFKFFADCRSLDEAKATYYRLNQSLHPDHNGGKDRGLAEMRQEYESWSVLFKYGHLDWQQKPAPPSPSQTTEPNRPKRNGQTATPTPQQVAPVVYPQSVAPSSQTPFGNVLQSTVQSLAGVLIEEGQKALTDWFRDELTSTAPKKKKKK